MGAYATGTPLLPSGYVAGTITLSDTSPHNLLTLIQVQLDVNCVGAGQEVTIQADTSGTVYVGNQSPIGGPLSTTNFGYQLTPGASRTYRTSFPGNSAPVGSLEVLMNPAGTLHVEVK
jgi:hypothetical protein